MKGAGGGRPEARGERREAEGGEPADSAEGSGTRSASRPFSDAMREWGMSAPAALARSIDRAAGVHSSQAAANSQELLKAAEQLLNRVLDGACESRDSAIDLLTVDALVTRAMEIAARDPKLLAEFPELAMKRLSAR